MTARHNPLAALTDDDEMPAPQPAPRKVRLPAEETQAIAAQLGFQSRETAPAKQRRYTTGRNQQVNVKARAETVALFHELADRLRIPQGEVLERALQALKKSL